MRCSSARGRWTALSCRAANILAYTMPGFATSERTLEPGAAADARGRLHAPRRSTSGPRAMQMLKDIGHPFAKGEQGLRHRLRERAGGRAHQPPFPPGQPARRAWSSARATCPSSRSAGAPTASATTCRTTTSNAQRAEDADPVPDRAGWPNPSELGPDVQRALRRVLDTEISPELVPATASQPTRDERGRPVRAAGLPPLLHAALRLRADQGRLPRLDAWHDASTALARRPTSRNDTLARSRAPGMFL